MNQRGQRYPALPNRFRPDERHTLVGMAIYQDVTQEAERGNRYYGLAEALEERGLLASALFRNTASDSPLARRVAPGVRMLDLAFGFVGKKFRWNDLLLRRQRLFDRFVSMRWRRLKPDIVVCNYPAPFTRVALNEWGGRLIFLDKGSLIMRRKIGGDPETGARTWRDANAEKNALPYHPDSFRVACDHVITMAEVDLPWYRALGVPATVIPNAIDVSWWRERAREQTAGSTESSEISSPGRPFHFLGMGSAPRRKNLMLLLQAWERAGAPGRLTIVAVPDEGVWRSAMAPYLSRFPSSLTVHFNKQWMPSHLAKAGLLVLPTQSEGAPRSVLEAACFGVPSLTTLPGRACLVDEDRTGWLVDPVTVDNLAARMATLAADPQRVREVGTRAATAIEEFDVTRYGPRIADIIQRIVDEEP